MDNIRNVIINKRNSLTKKDINTKSDKIFKKLVRTNEYLNCKLVLCYANNMSEVQTYKIIDDALKHNKIVALPKVRSSTDMDFHIIKSINDLAPGFKEILEPKENLITNNLIKNAIIIVPGVVFDKFGHRMGYGKGYYDRFIAKYNPKFKIGLAYELQINDNIIINEYDQKLDIIITENNIYR